MNDYYCNKIDSDCPLIPIKLKIDEILEELDIINNKEIVSPKVSTIVEDLALKIGMNKKTALEFGLHSQLHDIGKIKLIDLVTKKGLLTKEEYKLIKTHTNIGFSIAEQFNLHYASHMALLHHENYDGSGYPLGLSGTQIPIYCRILKIADIFDALKSERSYKPAWSLVDTMNGILEDKSGRIEPEHFDIEILGVLVDNCQRYNELYDNL